MSKSKGNVIDPLEVIDKYGADSLRMTLASLTVQGRDIFLSPERIESNRLHEQDLEREQTRPRQYRGDGDGPPPGRWVFKDP